MKRFYLQKEAFDYADNENAKVSSEEEIMRVFAFEEQLNNNTTTSNNTDLKNNNTGKRRYLLCTYDAFWEIYKDIPEKNRHFYEVIREKDFCNIYFDLEFFYKQNEEKNWQKMVFWLKQFITFALEEYFGIKFHTKKDFKFIELISLNSIEKFSMHLIIRFPAFYCFVNNNECGKFIQMIFLALTKNEPFERGDFYRRSSSPLSPMIVPIYSFASNQLTQNSLNKKNKKIIINNNNNDNNNNLNNKEDKFEISGIEIKEENLNNENNNDKFNDLICELENNNTKLKTTLYKEENSPPPPPHHHHYYHHLIIHQKVSQKLLNN